jgi:tetratricopeptide (TPR) repeat protein
MGRGSTQLVAVLYNNLSVLLFAAGQTQRAKEASGHALEIVRGNATPDPVLQGVYAKLLTYVGQAREALPLAERAVADARASGNERVKLIALQNGAVPLCAVGELARCDALLAEAQAGLERSKSGGGAMGALHVQQAEVALARADAKEAQRLLQRAVVLFESPAASMNAIHALALLARTELLLGDVTAAERHAQQAVDAARNAMAGFEHSRWLADARVAQGLVQRARGAVDAARASFGAALAELVVTDGEAAPATQEVRRLLAGG